jgi:hypothetical protein
MPVMRGGHSVLSVRLDENHDADNPLDRAQDGYERLESPNHWLGWLPGPSAGQVIRLGGLKLLWTISRWLPSKSAMFAA